MVHRRRLLALLRSPALLGSAAVAGVLTWLLLWQPFSPEEPPSEPTLLILMLGPTPQAGSVAVRLDAGHGIAANRPATLAVTFEASAGPQRLALALPAGRIHAVRLGFFGVPQIDLETLRLESRDGTVLASFPFREAHTVPGTTGALTGERLDLRSSTSAYLGLDAPLATPFTVLSGWEPAALEVAALFVLLTGALLGGQTLFAGRIPPTTSAAIRRLFLTIWQSAERKPPMALGAVALAASIASCFPVVFCDRSFVSPGNGAPLLLFGNPTIPGAFPEAPEDPKGADVAAMIWQNLPYSSLEHRALFADGEWPLWNRYSSGGVPLLGQGLSMLGDPLHLLPLLTNGAAWAWDLKFLAAKALFSLGLGLCVWIVTRRLGLAMLLAASCAWLGFFAFRFSHPAFFSVCYAPWVLLPWLGIRQVDGWRAWGWTAALVLADSMELASGTAKEASMLLVCLNFAGALVLVLDPGQSARRWRNFVQLAWASFLFALLSAPCWLVFIDALRQAATTYDTPAAYQLQPGLLLAFFDDLFSQDVTRQEYHTHPSLNFLVLAGMLWFAASWRRTLQDRTALALSLSALLPFSLVFGLFPPSWIVALPLLGKIEHLPTVFGAVLVILLPILAALGLRDCCAPASQGEWLRAWRRSLIFGALLLVLYLGFTQALPHHEAYFFHLTPLLHSRFFFSAAPALLVACGLFPLALRWLSSPGWALAGRALGDESVTKPVRFAGLALAAACLVVIHFRHGMYTSTKFDDYVMNPRHAADLEAQSPALDRVRRRLTEPARTYGLGYTLSPGYNALLGLEGLCGPDALMNREYREFCRAAQFPLDLDWRLRLDESALPQEKPLLDLLNLRFYLREGGAAVPPGLAPVGRADLQIFESKEAWPRAFFTDQVSRYGNVQDFVKMAREGDGRPFAATQSGAPDSQVAAVSESKTGARQVVPAHAYQLTTNTTAFTVSAPSAGVVVLSENFEPGNFRVTVNGASVPYFRVNHMYKGVRLPGAGEYRIVFRYFPRLLPLSLWLSAIGALFAVLTPLVQKTLLHRPRRLLNLQVEIPAGGLGLETA